jgi:hypothetical protein
MTDTKPKRYQCRHIFTDGRRCGSICLRGEELCYYHHTTRKPAQNPRARRSRRATFDLPLTDPNDRTALQSTIVEVLRRIAANDIDPRRAGLLLYGLQIASLNLPKPQTAQPGRKTGQPETVEEITTHPELGILAPKTDIDQIPINSKSAFATLLETFARTAEEERQQTAEDSSKHAAISTAPRLSAENQGNSEEPSLSTATPTQSPQPTTLPTLQAAAETNRSFAFRERGQLKRVRGKRNGRQPALSPVPVLPRFKNPYMSPYISLTPSTKAFSFRLRLG